MLNENPGMGVVFCRFLEQPLKFEILEIRIVSWGNRNADSIPGSNLIRHAL